MVTRRRFLSLSAQAGTANAALSMFPATIRRALAIPADARSGTIEDVQHIVILMLENRSFDHYFGTLRGVRGFADRHPVPLASGQPVWYQSDGTREIPPFWLDSKTTRALRVASTPHQFNNAQAAWNQGKFGFWPKFKTPVSMGYYRRDDIPFQFALAEAFTICDAHHCSITTGTDPNRIVFWSGSNYDPTHRERGENCTAADAEINNLRCQVTGTWPTPGYTYQASAFDWPTLPEILQKAGISWRIYQDPNDNWTGLMHGGLAFSGFRNAKAGEALYEQGLAENSLDRFKQDVANGTLPKVSWILPPMLWSEHPAPSSPPQGAEFTTKVLDALTANPQVWAQTVFFLSFDENDGLFDHVPPPAPPSLDQQGRPAGASTVDVRGEYLSDPERKYLHPEDTVTGTVRPWGLGPRVPLYVISPWSRGGWVNSQVFDHTSVGRFLENRFEITVPAISPWHRAVCGDLTSAFDFANPNRDPFPSMPPVGDSAAIIAEANQRPVPVPPEKPESLFQEPGMRRSRGLPYELHVHAQAHPANIKLLMSNTGMAGAVFHVYDKLHLDRIPRRFTVEAGKKLQDTWDLRADHGNYDLWVLGPNGFVREFRGSTESKVETTLEYDVGSESVRLVVRNDAPRAVEALVRANAYHKDGPWKINVPAHGHASRTWSVTSSHRWYDFTTTAEGLERRFAGRLETGKPSFSDPAV
jgi:phospholipase C